MTKRVLVVDDEFDIAESLRLVFEEEGFPSAACFNGAECLAFVERELPALIVLDVMMPVQSGLDVLRALRADERTASIPVILMSAVRPKVGPAEGGYQVFLQKPFGLDLLLDRVRDLLPKE